MTTRKAPPEVFAALVEYFPTISLNLIVENDRGEFLFVMRGKQPVKGYWWLPGGRILSGETVAAGAMRILHEETNLDGRIEWISPEYVMEFFEVGELDDQEKALYSDTIERFQYLTIPVHLRVDGDCEVLTDAQSQQFRWSKDDLSGHEYISKFFDMWRRACG